ncbi:uncharacterized protein G2W53_028939 [Senna tora]|uniref:Uncharacterized protein n=1 Tax=Senna tora TaxID=362788 RepID=A0A834W9A0_9FABA|nr:uncharacterized protein G2W53_028939 [Senna tora]
MSLDEVSKEPCLVKHRNFRIGEASRPLILNPRNKASRPWDWWGIETHDFKSKEQGIGRLGFVGH